MSAMSRVVGRVAALARYPVKSMRGEALDHADLGWHGLEGDRRLGVRRVEDTSGFPWLTASRLPSLVCFTPERDPGPARDAPHGASAVPTHVRTPEGVRWPVYDPALAADLAARCGMPVELVHLRGGIFDDAAVSLISAATVRDACAAAGVPPDARRFRPNVVLDLDDPTPFAEDAWVGGTITFGEGPGAASVLVTARDLRCVMVNLDPDTGVASPALLKALGQARHAMAGLYGTVARAGSLAVGQPVTFTPASAVTRPS